MSILESERRRSQRAQRKHRKQQRRAKRTAPQPQSPLVGFENDDNRVLSFAQWCALNGFSPRTGRKILAGGCGPPVVQLSSRRIGITLAANKLWQEARTRG